MLAPDSGRASTRPPRADRRALHDGLSRARSPPLLVVGAGASAQFDGMAVVGHDQVALRCDGGRLWLADTYVGRGAGTAVTGQDCDLHVEGGQPWDNHRGAILLEGDSRLTMADAVVALNGQPVDDRHPLVSMLLEHVAGDTVTLDVLRDGQVFQTQLTLGERA